MRTVATTATSCRCAGCSIVDLHIVSGDRLARRRALDAGGSFIVRAPAGSGKTELLIRRFLLLLGRVREPEEIVAITFTRKAAAEMRARVTDAMREAERGEEGSGSRAALARSALDNDRRRGWRLLQHPSRLQILTIDALCVLLTRQTPWMSRLGAPPRIVDDATELYRTAAADTIRLLGGGESAWSDAVALVLRHLDNRAPRLVDLLVRMLAQRDQWLRHVGSGNMATRRRELETAWAEVVTSELRTVHQLMPQAWMGELAACARYAATHNHSDPLLQPWQDHKGALGATPAELPLWRGVGRLLTRSGRWRKRVDRRQGFPAIRGDKLAQDMRRRMQALLAALADDEELLIAVDGVSGLPEVAFDDAHWQLLEAMIEVLRLAAARLQTLFAERGEMDFTEINQRANRALGDADAPTDLGLRLDLVVQHLLVDEFQDTSISQLTLFEQLTAGWQREDGRTVFLVGDPMQSIYRFREAEVSLFQKVQQQGLGTVAVEPLALTTNFRCAPSLVGWQNQVFGECFPKQGDVSRGAVNYATAVAAGAGPSGGVHLRTEGGSQAAAIAELIEQVWSRNADATIAVLVRARGHLEALLPALIERRIGYEAVDIEPLAGKPVILDLRSLTRALLFPADRLSWLAVLRAPWCGLTIADLLVLARASSGGCLWSALETPAIGLSADGRRRLARIMPALRRAHEQCGRIPLPQLVESTWYALGGPACVGEAGSADAESYFSLLIDHDQGGRIGDMKRFARALDGLWARPDLVSTRRVQVMTIHRAKGLEFDTVIVPHLEKPPRPADAPILRWEERAVNNKVRSLLLAPSLGNTTHGDRRYAYLQKLARDKDRFESMRLLYVACTRARQDLHLFAEVRRKEDGAPVPPSRNSLLALIWDSIGDQLTPPQTTQLSLFDGPRAVRRSDRLRRLPGDYSLPSMPELSDRAQSPVAPAGDTAVEFSWAGETARLVGIVVHSVLEQIAREGGESWDAARLESLTPALRAMLQARGVVDDRLGEALDRCRAALTGVVDDPRGRWLLSGKHQDARSELPLGFRRGGELLQRRIDRCFVDEQQRRWIVDFKTSAHEGGDTAGFLDAERERYRAQLQEYAGLFRQLEDRQIMLGLYFPLLQGWREWAFDGT